MRLSMVTGTTQLNQRNLHSVHVIIAKCLKDNKDKDNFLDRLGTLLPETKITCYVYPV
jgi:hypothetical protein